MFNHKISIRVILLSYMVLIVVWGIRELLVDLSFLNSYVEYTINFIIWAICWFGFATLLIHRYNNDLKITFKEMITTKPTMRILIPLLLFTVIYNTIVWITNGYKIELKMELYEFILIVIGVGLFEEIVFRGWFMNSLCSFFSDKKANLLSSVLFVFIHYPRWISLGRDAQSILISSLMVYCLGLIFGWAFRKTRSVWTPAIMHSLWDFFAFLL